MDNISRTVGLALTALMFLGAGIWSLVRAKENQRSAIAHYESTPKNWIERLNRYWPPGSDWVKSPHYLLSVRITGAVSIAVGVALLLLLVVGLLVSSAGPYQTYTLAEDDIRFSWGGIVLQHPRFTFEYPTSFRLVDLNKRRPHVITPDITRVSFLRDNKLKLQDGITVSVRKPSLSEYKDAKDFVDQLLSPSAADPSKVTVLESSQKTIAGIPAEYVSFSVYETGGTPYGYPPYTTLVRLLAFDYKGFVWVIRMGVYIENGQETAPYFEHLVATFRFVE